MKNPYLFKLIQWIQITKVIKHSQFEFRPQKETILKSFHTRYLEHKIHWLTRFTNYITQHPYFFFLYVVNSVNAMVNDDQLKIILFMDENKNQL